MVGGSESSQLVTVDRVVLEEKLHLLSDLHAKNLKNFVNFKCMPYIAV